VDGIAGYYQPLDTQRERPPLPVVLLGQFADGGPSTDMLQQALQREVLPFATALTYPEDFPLDEYTANLGLIVADQSRARAQHFIPEQAGPWLNLLPERHLRRRAPLAPALALIAILLLGGFSAFWLTGEVEEVKSREAALSARLPQLVDEQQEQVVLARARALRAGNLTEINQEIEGLESHLADLRSDLETRLVRIVDRLARITKINEVMPPGVQLPNLIPQGDGFALSGTAPTYQEVFDYADNLEASGLFSDVRILWIKVSGPATVKFQMLASVPPPLEAAADGG